MKKLIIIVGSVLCSAAIYVGINAYSNNSQTSLLAQNIEALTQGEGGVGVNCVDKIIPGGNGIYTCNPCKWVERSYAAIDANYGKCN